MTSNYRNWTWGFHWNWQNLFMFFLVPNRKFSFCSDERVTFPNYPTIYLHCRRKSIQILTLSIGTLRWHRTVKNRIFFYPPKYCNCRDRDFSSADLVKENIDLGIVIAHLCNNVSSVSDWSYINPALVILMEKLQRISGW